MRNARQKRKYAFDVEYAEKEAAIQKAKEQGEKSNVCPDPNCHMSFSCPLMRDSHRSRYPQHFTKEPTK